MRRSDLLKSTPFRLALLFSALFFVTFFLAGLLAYQFILSDLRDRLDSSIGDSFQLIAATHGTSELEDLVATVQGYAAVAKRHDRLYFLADSSGRKLAGNIAVADIADGLSTQPGAAFGLPSDTHYRVIRQPVDDLTLLVGSSLNETDELSALTMTSFAWAGIAASLVAILAGILLAGAIHRRMTAIAVTMAQVGRGELAARIPIRGSNDDVDLLSRQVNAALERLSALVDGMRQVSVDIAHDLKTPLNRMSITIETALDLADQGQSNRQPLLQAQEAAVQINETFEALLRIAQLEAGNRRERFVTVAIDQVVEAIAEIYADVAEDSGMQLRMTNLNAGPLEITGDRDLLTQLFANLVENAIRHGHRGESIALAISRSASGVVVSVADHGPGIPEEERSKVFQRLYRLEKSRTTPGSGLGLSMVKAIADLHGARIDLVDNKPGLKVVVSFPAASGAI